jgi:hypothetical protein
MNGFRKIFPIFLSHYATFFAKMAERKVVPFDEFYYQLKLMHPFQKHPVYKTECLFVCIYCMQIYSFTQILMKFCTLDLQNKKKITVYFNSRKTNPYYHFQPC